MTLGTPATVEGSRGERGGPCERERAKTANRVLRAASWGSLALAAALSAVRRLAGRLASAGPLGRVARSRSRRRGSGRCRAACSPARPGAAARAPRRRRQPIQLRVYTEGELPPRRDARARARPPGRLSALVHDDRHRLRPVFDFRYASAGDRYRLAQTSTAALADFDYRRSEFESYTLRRDGEQLVAERIEPEVQVEHARVAGRTSRPLRRRRGPRRERRARPRLRRDLRVGRGLLARGPARRRVPRSSTSGATSRTSGQATLRRRGPHPGGPLLARDARRALRGVLRARRRAGGLLPRRRLRRRAPVPAGAAQLPPDQLELLDGRLHPITGGAARTSASTTRPPTARRLGGRERRA